MEVKRGVARAVCITHDVDDIDSKAQAIVSQDEGNMNTGMERAPFKPDPFDKSTPKLQKPPAGLKLMSLLRKTDLTTRPPLNVQLNCRGCHTSPMSSIFAQQQMVVSSPGHDTTRP